MGGRAFENLVRIKREDINSTLSNLADVLDFPGLTFEYMRDNLMGSANKQADSGDLDIAVCSDAFDHRVLYTLAERCREVLGGDAVRSKGLKAGQLNTAVNIPGTDDYVQVDFIYGDLTWLKFTHWSPGQDVSPFKGVFISQTLGVLAKMKVLYSYPENAVVDKDADVDERQAEVAFAYDLEKGMYVRCRLRYRDGSFRPMDADAFETKCPVVPPRVPRHGYMTDPETVVRLCVGKDVTLEDVQTFEGLLAAVKRNFDTERYEQFKERLVESLLRSSARREATREELEALL